MRGSDCVRYMVFRDTQVLAMGTCIQVVQSDRLTMKYVGNRQAGWTSPTIEENYQGRIIFTDNMHYAHPVLY